MAKRLFLSALRHIELKEFDVDDFELMPGVLITNKGTVIEKLLEETGYLLGAVESYHISVAPALLYFEFDDDGPFKENTNLQNVELIFVWIHELLKNSWFVKDNAVTCDAGYGIHFTPGIEVSSSLLRYLHTNSDGGIDVTVFTFTELKEWAKVHHTIEEYLHSKGSGSFQFMLEKSFSRIGRSLNFIKQARESRNLAYKLSHYCSALETLFTSDSTELAHKLSERVAFLLQDKYNRLETYRILKKAYNIRSKLTHGASIDKTTIGSLPDISKGVDDRLREIFTRIATDNQFLTLLDGSSTTLDNYFEELIFGM